MADNSLIPYFFFNFHQNPTVTIAVTMTLIIIAITVWFLIYIIFRRINFYFLEKRKKKNSDLWSENLFNYLERKIYISDFAKLIKKKETDMFIEFLFYFLENIKGDDAKRIGRLFKGLGLLERELNFLVNSKHDWRRALAAYRLGQIRTKNAKKELIQALTDKSDLVSYTAAAALMKIGDRDSIGEILAILLSKDGLSGELFAEILLGYGKGVVAELSETLSIYNQLPRSRTKIIDFLGYFKRVEIAPFLIKLLETSTNNEEKIHVIKALGNLTDIESFPALVKCLDNSNLTIKSQAAKALGNFKEESAFGPLSELLDDKDWWCRYHAALSIYKTGESGKIYLKELFEKKTDPFAKDVIKQVIRESEW
jgi:hypothetical protein